MHEDSKRASTVWNAGRAVWNGIKEATILGIGGTAEGGGAATMEAGSIRAVNAVGGTHELR